MLGELESAVVSAIADCNELMTHTTVTFEDELKKGKDKDKDDDDDETGEDNDDESSDKQE